MTEQASLSRIVNLAGRVKTPLALAGLVVVILYALYNELLKSNLLDPVGEQPTFQLLQDLLGKIFWLALVAMVLGVASYITELALTRRVLKDVGGVSSEDRGSSLVRVLGVKVFDEASEVRSFRRQKLGDSHEEVEEKGLFPVLLAKVKNVGSRPLLLTGINLAVRRLEVARRLSGTLPLNALSWEYNILLDPRKERQTARIDASQPIGAEEAVEIPLVIGHSTGYGESGYVAYEISVTLHTPGKDLELGSQHIRIPCVDGFEEGKLIPLRVLEGGSSG